jgi:hypothetical protein
MTAVEGVTSGRVRTGIPSRRGGVPHAGRGVRATTVAATVVHRGTWGIRASRALKH